MCNENSNVKNEEVKPDNSVDSKQETKPVVRLRTIDRIGLVGVIAASALAIYSVWASESND